MSIIDRVALSILATHVMFIGSEMTRRKVPMSRVKADTSLVSDADLSLEIRIAHAIKSLFENIPIRAEEFSSEAEVPAKGLYIDADPMDGSSYYLMGSDMWGISIGFLYDRKPIAGILAFPAQGDGFLAEEDGRLLRCDCREFPPKWEEFKPVVQNPGKFLWDDTGKTSPVRQAIDVARITTALGLQAKRMPALVAGKEVFSHNCLGGPSRTVKSWDMAAQSVFLKRSGCVIERLCDGGELPWEQANLPPTLVAASREHADRMREAILSRDC